MAHALNNCSHTSVCAELGITRGNDRTTTSLTRHASINKWSFYRSGSISPNATTKLIALTAPSNNDKLGDFRGYNHSAATPTTPSDFSDNYLPTDTYLTLVFVVYLNEFNVREATSGSTPYISVRYYLTTTGRLNKTGASRTYTVAVSETSVTPPTGHTNNQTAKPASASQIVTDSAFPSAILSTPTDYIYCDIYISDISGNEVARLGETQDAGWVNVTANELSAPWVDAVGTCPTRTSPVYYTGCHTEINNVSTSCTGADVPLSAGSTAYSFYLRAVGINSGTYNINPTNCTVRITHYNSSGGTRQTIYLYSQNLNTYSKNGKYFSGNVTNTFNYGDYLKVDITSVSTWGTAYLC